MMDKSQNYVICPSGFMCLHSVVECMAMCMQARDISPAHLGATLSVLLGGASAASREGTKQWSAHIASAADAAVQAAEASFGVEGAHESALAQAQAIVMATDGFSAQVCSCSCSVSMGCHALSNAAQALSAVLLMQTELVLQPTLLACGCPSASSIAGTCASGSRADASLSDGLKHRPRPLYVKSCTALACCSCPETRF